jgi:hypothetical protein
MLPHLGNPHTSLPSPFLHHSAKHADGFHRAAPPTQRRPNHSQITIYKRSTNTATVEYRGLVAAKSNVMAVTQLWCTCWFACAAVLLEKTGPSVRLAGRLRAGKASIAQSQPSMRRVKAQSRRSEGSLSTTILKWCVVTLRRQTLPHRGANALGAMGSLRGCQGRGDRWCGRRRRQRRVRCQISD